MIGFDSPEVQADMLAEFIATTKRVWAEIQRIIAETLTAIVRWVKRNYPIVRSVCRSLGYRPETIMTRKLRRL